MGNKPNILKVAKFLLAAIIWVGINVQTAEANLPETSSISISDVTEVVGWASSKKCALSGQTADQDLVQKEQEVAKQIDQGNVMRDIGETQVLDMIGITQNSVFLRLTF